MYCVPCGKEAMFKCARCNQVSYCSQLCQTNHWKEHRLSCIELAKTGLLDEAERARTSELKKELFRIAGDAFSDVSNRFKFFRVSGYLPKDLKQDLKTNWDELVQDSLDKAYYQVVVASTQKWIARFDEQHVQTFAVTAKMKTATGEIKWRLASVAVVLVNESENAAYLALFAAKKFVYGVTVLSLGKLLHYLMFANLEKHNVHNLYLEAAYTVVTTTNKDGYSLRFDDVNNKLVQYYMGLLYRISVYNCEDGKTDWRKLFPGVSGTPVSEDERENRSIIFKADGHGFAMSWCGIDKTRLETETRNAIEKLHTTLQFIKANDADDLMFSTS